MLADEQRWNDLRIEYERERIGNGWLDLIVEVCTRTARKYPPAIYNGGLAWDESGIADLVQDVIVERLFGRGQIDYIVASTSTLDGARGLIATHVKQVLAHRLIPNQRDNIAKRLHALFERDGQAIHTGDGQGYIPRNSDWGPAEPTTQALASAARAIAKLPRLPNHGTDRLSPLFTTEVLETALQPLWNALQVPVTLVILRQVLESALTDIAPMLFDQDEQIDKIKLDGLSTEELVLTDELAERLIEALTPEQRHILVNAGVLNDSELANVLGVSRPTALKRRHEARDVIADYFNQPEIQDLEPHLREVVLLKAIAHLGGHE